MRLAAPTRASNYLTILKRKQANDSTTFAGESMPTVRCDTCGLSMQVPVGGRRQCACGSWLSGDEAPVAIPVVGAVPEEGEKWPRMERDLAAIETLNNGSKR